MTWRQRARHHLPTGADDRQDAASVPVCICAACGHRIEGEAVFHLSSGLYHFRCIPDPRTRQMFGTGR